MRPARTEAHRAHRQVKKMGQWTRGLSQLVARTDASALNARLAVKLRSGLPERLDGSALM